MTLFKSMWKAVVLMGIAGVLGFAGLAGAADFDFTAPASIASNLYTFTAKTAGYTLATADTISFTATNTGANVLSDVNATLKTGTGFNIISTASPTVAATNGTHTFKVAPKPGLAAATYEDSVIVEEASPGTERIAVGIKFVVSPPQQTEGTIVNGNVRLNMLASQSVSASSGVEFKLAVRPAVALSGGTIAYKWFRYTDAAFTTGKTEFSGNDSVALPRTVTKASGDSVEYIQASITDPGTTKSSSSAKSDTKTVNFTVTVKSGTVKGSPAVISKSPNRDPIDVVEGETQDLTVFASGVGTLSYAWAKCDGEESSCKASAVAADWDNIASATATTYTVPTTDAAFEGSETGSAEKFITYRVSIKDAGADTSAAADSTHEYFAVRVVRALEPYTLSWEVVNGHGKISASVASGATYPAREKFQFTVNFGNEVTLKATADPGYRVKSWTIGEQAFTSGGLAGGQTSEAKYTMGAFDDKVTVEFEVDPAAPQYVIGYKPAGEMIAGTSGTPGSVSAEIVLDGFPSGVNPGKSVYGGVEVTFTAAIEKGFRVKHWVIRTNRKVEGAASGSKQASDNWLDTLPGSLDSDGNGVLRVTAAEALSKKGNGSTTRDTIGVDAWFEKIPAKYEVKFASADNAKGAVSAAYAEAGGAAINSADSVESGRKVVFTATRIGNNRVVNWFNGSTTALTSNLSAGKVTCTLTVSADVNVSATFDRPVVVPGTISAVSGANLTIGSINATLQVSGAKVQLGGNDLSPAATMSYQWYSLPTADALVPTRITGATASTYKIPTDLTAGVTYYYYAEVGEKITTDFDGDAEIKKTPVYSVAILPANATVVAAVKTWVSAWNVIRGENGTGDANNIQYDLSLPTDSASIVNLVGERGIALPVVVSGLSAELTRKALSGVKISWTSSKPGALNGAGSVTRPMFGTADSGLTLTAAIAKEDKTDSYTYNLTVKMYQDQDYYQIGQVWNSLTWAVIDTNTRASGGRDINGLRNNNVVRNIKLPTVASTANGLAEFANVVINWNTSAGASVLTYKTIDNTRAVGEISRLKTNNLSFDLVATIKKTDGTAQMTKTFKATVPVKEAVGADFIVFENESKVYNGTVQYPSNARIPSTQVSKFGPMLDTTYSFVEASALNVGTYRVTVVFDGMDGYSLPRERVLTIAAKPLSSASVKLTVDPLPASSLIYDGEPKGVAAYTVTDGTNDLLKNTDYTALYRDWNRTERADGVLIAGTGNNLVITGRGNYSGTLSYTFAVTKKAVSLDLDNCAVSPKEYDGTTAVVKSNVKIAVTGLVTSDETAFNAAAPFNVSALAYNGSNVTKTAIVQGSARLDTAGLTATQKLIVNNYTLATAPAFRKTDAEITLRTPVKADISIGKVLPDSALRTGVAATFGAPAFTGSKTNGTGGNLTLQFAYSDGLSAKVPVEVGTYEVYVVVKGATNPNFVDGNVAMGSWIINKPLSAVISSQSADTTIRAKGTAVLSVAATSPNEGSLTYRWFRNDTLISGATANTYRFATSTATVLGEYNFYAMIINQKASGALAQSPDTVRSNTIKVTVDEAAKSIEAARVTVVDQFEYDGFAKIPVEVQVQLGQDQLTSDDFDIAYLNNVNAGMAVVNITGKNRYEGKASGSFRITQKALVYGEDFDVRSVVTYNGKAQPLQIIPLGAVSGLGAATVTYDGKSDVPVNAGTYAVIVKFAAGQNYLATDTMSLGDYDILQKLITEEDLSYTKWPSEVLPENAKGIGSVKVRDTTLAGYGTVTVKYNEQEAVPTELGSYKVTVTVSGGANYYYTIIPLGDYNIVEFISVAQNDRVIPGKGVTEEAAIAPVKVIASGFAVGPNVVSKATGKVTFFSGRSVKSGSLYVFDANGNAVAKIAAKQVGKEVATWNLKSKGAAVAEGTYVVKGALIGKDGTKEKVSSLFTVVK